MLHAQICQALLHKPLFDFSLFFNLGNVVQDAGFHGVVGGGQADYLVKSPGVKIWQFKVAGGDFVRPVRQVHDGLGNLVGGIGE